MTTTPTGHPTPDLAARGGEDGERLVRRFVTVLAVTVGGLCFLFSLGNVYQLAVDLKLWVWIRPLVAPAVDLSLVALVVGIRFLARRGVSGKELRRPRLFLLAVGVAAWALNTAHASPSAIGARPPSTPWPRGCCWAGPRSCPGSCASSRP